MSIIPNINNQSIAILSDIEQWKEDIADAINTKGGEASAESSFSQLAEDIKNLPIDGNLTYGIEFTDSTSSILENLCSGVSFDSSIKNIIDNDGLIKRLGSIKIFAQETIYFKILPSLTSTNKLDAKFLYLPNCSVLSNGAFDSQRFEKMVFGRITKMSWMGSYNFSLLRDITIGTDTNINLGFNQWTASSVIAEGQSSIDELNLNLYNNLLTKLYDHSNDGETRILQIGWLDYITPENIAYANAKGWTISN